MHELTQIDLFSGIGGFALAAQWAGFRTVAFCEIELFCQEVLKARFGVVADTGNAQTPRQRGNGGEILSITESMGFDRNYPLLIPDIHAFDGTQFRGATLLTGGVPCQPASIAGKRKGTADDRWLWPEAIRVLVEVKPVWAIFENPCGILSLEQGVVFEDLLSQMEGEGYEVRPVIIPACAVNAPHRRDRVWIIAHTKQPENYAPVNELSSQNSIERRNRRWHYGDTSRLRRVLQIAGPDSDAPDASSQRLSGDVQRKLKGVSSKIRSPERGQPSRGTTENEQWEEPWFEVATRLCRVDARVSSRVDRLKALGNSIVPQVAYQIIKTIAEIEREGLT